MNRTPVPSEAELQAYVDGRLAPADVARVEAYLQEHPDIAQQLQAYQMQNQLLHSMFDHVLDEPVPSRLNTVTERRPRPFISRVAAVLAWVALGGVSGYFVHGAYMPSVTRAAPFAERAALAHVVYTAEVLHPVEVMAGQDQHLVKWLSKRLGHALHTPDLSRFGYQLLGGRLLPGDDKGAAAQFMYQNQAGARLTLYIGVRDHGTGQTAFRITERDGQKVMYWVDNDLSFALVGVKDRNQLLSMARVTYEAMNYQ